MRVVAWCAWCMVCLVCGLRAWCMVCGAHTWCMHAAHARVVCVHMHACMHPCPHVLVGDVYVGERGGGGIHGGVSCGIYINILMLIFSNLLLLFDLFVLF